MVIDWSSDDRVELEAAMKEGLAVIEYSCDKVRVLSDCHVEGAYRFTGVQPKQEVRQLANADEFKAALPKSATGKLGASASTELERGNTLDIATVIVGRKRTVRDSVTKADLKGKCDGATHLVRAARVGAFAKDQGKKGKAKTAAELFGSSSSGNSTASAFSRSIDGSLEACAKADAEGTKPPPQCGALVSLELLPVEDKASTNKTMKQDSETEQCPRGMVYSSDEHKCVKEGTAKNFVCEPGDVKVCKEQCDKGNGESCFLYADSIGTTDPYTGEKNPAGDEAAQDAAYKKACDLGSLAACSSLAYDELEHKKITAEAFQAIIDKGVKAGDIRSMVVGGMYNIPFFASFNPNGDIRAGRKLLQRGCEAGDKLGCAIYGLSFLDGIIAANDPKNAKKLNDPKFIVNAFTIDAPPEDVKYVVDANVQMCGPKSWFNCEAAALLSMMRSPYMNLDKAPTYVASKCNPKKDDICDMVAPAFLGQLKQLYAKVK
ncbi:MAG: hypothetical protein U0165_01480 [Polyangiaceae bacterium]